MKQIDYKKIRKERRFKVLYIEEEEVLDLIIAKNGNVPFFSKITKLRLPEDYYVLNVYHSPEQKAFGFLISSKTFPSIELGCYPPSLNQEIEIQRIDFIENKDFKGVK